MFKPRRKSGTGLVISETDRLRVLIEIQARRPGFEPKRQVYCLAATCNGRCALSFPRLKAERVTAKEDMTFKAKKPRYLLPVPDGHVDWQPNVVGEFKPTDTEIGNPFVYATEVRTTATRLIQRLTYSFANASARWGMSMKDVQRHYNVIATACGAG